MDVLYFMKERTRFIRQYYDTAAAPFNEIKRKIEAKEDPYEPPYSEDPEPPFLDVWMDAQTGLEILGLSCVSMLSESLKLYFMTWESELRIECQPQLTSEFKAGFLHGYKVCFGHALNVEWEQCAVDFDIIEQVVLARNRGQHPENIFDIGVKHSDKDREKYPMPFFTNEYEKNMLGTDEAQVPWMNPSLTVTRETLLNAIEQVELLGDWLEGRMFEAIYPTKYQPRV